MAIINFPSKDVFTKQAKIFVYNNNTATSGTYYTTLNSTGAKGRLSKITLVYGSASVFNNNLTIRVTIDGVANSVGIPSTNVSVGLMHSGTSGGTIYNPSQSIDYFCDIVFYNSVLVEFMQNAAGTYAIEGSIMYSIE